MNISANKHSQFCIHNNYLHHSITANIAIFTSPFFMHRELCAFVGTFTTMLRVETNINHTNYK